MSRKTTGSNMIYVTSDQHFGHNNIISLTGRMFQDSDEMDAHMVQAWNSVVGPRDTVYHLGDLFWHIEVALQILPQLNGTIRLIKGNHDYWLKDPVAHSGGVIWNKIELLEPLHRLNFNKTKIWLCHYPLRSWVGSFRGAMHCYGHVHNTIEKDRLPRAMDVGVDAIGYVPLTVERIWEYLSKDPIVPEELRIGGGLSHRQEESKDEQASLLSN